MPQKGPTAHIVHVVHIPADCGSFVVPAPDVSPCAVSCAPVVLQIVENIDDLAKGFDPAKALSFTVEYQCAPPLQWTTSHKDIKVTITYVCLSYEI